MLPKVRLKRGEKGQITKGFPWVYDGQIGEMAGSPAPGGLVRVLSDEGKRLGEGYFSPKSRIRVRLLSGVGEEPVEDEEAAKGLIARRLADAAGLRDSLGLGKSCRMVFGESDGLPGLTIDRYGDSLVVQIAFEGMERLREFLVEAICEVFPGAAAVVERSDTGPREREGLSPRRGVLKGSLPADGRVPFCAGGLDLFADVIEGQKTGFYLDQVENWFALRSLAKGRRVLDMCCYSGAFGLSMLKGGAVSLLGVDSSRRAVETAAMTAEANGSAGSARFESGDAAEVLAGFAREKKEFDLIILDPSAFAKSRSHAGLARRALASLNVAALAAAASGCLFFTCSCTPWVDAQELAASAAAVAKSAGRELRVLEMRGQSRDHPIHPLIPGTRYLSCALCHVS